MSLSIGKAFVGGEPTSQISSGLPPLPMSHAPARRLGHLLRPCLPLRGGSMRVSGELTIDDLGTPEVGVHVNFEV
jgi:hypothetical protein